MRFSTTPKSASYPVQIKSPPCTTHRTSSSALEKQHGLAVPRTSPKLPNTEVCSASRRAGAARAP
eukprot:9745315-Alexandrium_andersonii.AAC.1